jgi:hypothetical protein
LAAVLFRTLFFRDKMPLSLGNLYPTFRNITLYHDVQHSSSNNVAQYCRIAKFPRLLKFKRNIKFKILSFIPNSEVFHFNGNNTKSSMYGKFGSQEFIDAPL